MILGSKKAGTEPDSFDTKKSAVPKSPITPPNDQASINITPVINNPFIPLIHTSIASEIVKILLKTPKAIATILASSAD